MNIGDENEYQEFKEGLGQLDKGLKSITAMLNKHGQANVFSELMTMGMCVDFLLERTL